ncbi:BCNT-domain-containing protein, partial [Colletotrichum eremochloae]
EEYESSQDSDFAPEDAVAADGASEASDSETDGEDAAAGTTKPAKRKRDGDGDGGEAEDAGFENSGDEALIKKAKKKRRRKAKDGDAAAAPDEEDEGGDGGLVKTRSMRAAEKQERKTAAVSGPVTVDVEAIWAQMLAGQTATPPITEDKTTEETDAVGSKQPSGPEADAPKPDEALGGDPSEMVRIKRTYNFAGKVHTEEKLVARSSAEAKLYFASLGKDASADVGGGEEEEEPKRVLKKAFRSAFEPVIEVTGQRSDLNLGVAVRIKAREKEAQAKKLNTVEKSKMDWAGFVDKEGLKDELELAGRAKGSYAERQDFLARSEAKREEEARRARLA